MVVHNTRGRARDNGQRERHSLFSAAFQQSKIRMYSKEGVHIVVVYVCGARRALKMLLWKEALLLSVSGL